MAPLTKATEQYVDEGDVSLREYLESRIESVKESIHAAERAHDVHQTEITKSLEARFDSIEEAVKVALEANEKRLDSMNEWRGTIEDLNKTFITKNDHDNLVNMVDKDIEGVQKDIVNLRSLIESLNITRATLDGKASQTQLNINFLFTLFAFIVGLAGLILGFFGR
jgi:chromosome segregation ATPase